MERTVGINCRYLGALQNSELGKQDRLFLIEVSMLLAEYSVVEIMTEGRSRSSTSNWRSVFPSGVVLLCCVFVFHIEVCHLSETNKKYLKKQKDVYFIL